MTSPNNPVHAFYYHMTCPVCEDVVFFGPCITLLTHAGLPVVPGDLAAEERLVCDEGHEFFTGDLNVSWDEQQDDRWAEEVAQRDEAAANEE